MYQSELLDRMLTSVQRTEEAFIDINNRVISNINARKDRLNMINARIQAISQKILTLYDQKRLLKIISPAKSVGRTPGPITRARISLLQTLCNRSTVTLKLLQLGSSFRCVGR